MRIERTWSAQGNTVEYEMTMPATAVEAKINDATHVAIKHGPIVLAIDSRYGTPIHDTVVNLANGVALAPSNVLNDGWTPMVAYETPGVVAGEARPVTLVDYASAGSFAPGHDEFRVWLPPKVTKVLKVD